jgi:hypothetical protein
VPAAAGLALHLQQAGAAGGAVLGQPFGQVPGLGVLLDLPTVRWSARSGWSGLSAAQVPREPSRRVASRFPKQSQQSSTVFGYPELSL